MATQYVPEGIPFLRSLNVEPLRVKTADMKFISADFHERLKKSALAPGDVVIVRTGKPGACVVIPDWLPVANCSDVVIVRCGQNLSPHFLAYYVNAIAQDHVSAHLVGAVQQHFNVGAARKIKIPLPPIGVQEQITAVLRAFDQRIDVLEDQNKALEAIARAIFKSWFVDFDPVRAKAEGREPEGMDNATAALFPSEFSDSRLGIIPRGWSVRKIEELADKVGMGPFGSSIKVETFVPTGVPIISGNHLRTFLLEDSTHNFITEDHAQRLVKANVFADDIVFTHAGNIGNVSLIPESPRYPAYVISQRQFFMRCNLSEITPRYVVLYFTSDFGRHRLLANASSVGVPSIARPVTYLRSLELLVPARRILERFDDLVGPLFRSIERNRKHIDTLREIRDTLLPRLISGKLRVPEAEKMAEAVI